MNEPLLTEAEAVAYFKSLNIPMSPVTMYRRRKDGKLPYYQYGQHIRFKVSDLDAFVERHRKGR